MEDSRKKSVNYQSPRGTSEWTTRIHGEHQSVISAPVSTKYEEGMTTKLNYNLM